MENTHWTKKSSAAVDRTVFHVNEVVTWRNIPLSASDYIVNGKSALAWVIDGYRVTKASGLGDDPNTWSDDPRYVVGPLQTSRVSEHGDAAGHRDVASPYGTDLPTADKRSKEQP